MYDPRAVRPKKLRKRSKIIDKKKKDKKAVDLNAEDEEKHEKSFYANLMKKRSMVNELVKSVETSNKGKRGSMKADITYPYKPVEEVAKPIAKSVVIEDEVIKPDIEKTKMIDGKLDEKEDKSKVDGKLFGAKEVSEDYLLKVADVKPIENKLFENKPAGLGLFENKPLETKKTDLFAEPSKPVETKPLLFGQTNTSLFTNKPEETKAKELEQPKQQAPAFVLPNQPQQQSSLFGNTFKKSEEAPKEETKPVSLFGNQPKPVEDKKPAESQSGGLFSIQPKTEADKEKTEPAKPALFGNQTVNLFSNTEKKLDNELPKPVEIKPSGTSLFPTQGDTKPNLFGQSTGGFKLDASIGAGLFGNKPTEAPKTSLTPQAEQPKPEPALKPIPEEKNDTFEEEQETKQDKPQTPNPNPLFNPQSLPSITSPFMSPSPNLPPNENPLANPTQNLFTSNMNTSGGLFSKPDQNISTPPSQRNEPPASNLFNMGNQPNALTSPNTIPSNPFISAPSNKIDPKSPNPFITSGKSTGNVNKSGGSAKGDLFTQRINDINKPGGAVGFNTGLAVGSNSAGLFGNQQQALFGQGQGQQNANPLFGGGQNMGQGGFGGNGVLFGNRGNQG